MVGLLVVVGFSFSALEPAQLVIAAPFTLVVVFQLQDVVVQLLSQLEAEQVGLAAHCLGMEVDQRFKPAERYPFRLGKAQRRPQER